MVPGVCGGGRAWWIGIAGEWFPRQKQETVLVRSGEQGLSITVTRHGCDKHHAVDNTVLGTRSYEVHLIVRRIRVELGSRAKHWIGGHRIQSALTTASPTHQIMAGCTSIQDRLIGAWELLSYVVHSEQSPATSLYPLGEHAKGIIMYTPDGYMSAQLQNPGQDNFSSAQSPIDGTERELAESGRRYIAYSGPYYLEGEDVVLHHFSVSSFPNWLGQTQRRKVRLDGDELVITLEAPVELKVSPPCVLGFES